MIWLKKLLENNEEGPVLVLCDNVFPIKLAKKINCMKKKQICRYQFIFLYIYENIILLMLFIVKISTYCIYNDKTLVTTMLEKVQRV